MESQSSNFTEISPLPAPPPPPTPEAAPATHIEHERAADRKPLTGRERAQAKHDELERRRQHRESQSS